MRDKNVYKLVRKGLTNAMNIYSWERHKNWIESRQENLSW
jgi:hypothetical protein